MDDAAIRAISRPHPNLLKMYILQALATVFAFPIVILPLVFKYHTLKYKFDDEGISASWGVLFRREIYLTYRRIQDIHVSRNLFERWLGIGKVEIQTASGSASAELSIEGMEDYAGIRDYLYGKMRGTGTAPATASDESTAPDTVTGGEAEMVELLRGIKNDVDAVRCALERQGEEG